MDPITWVAIGSAVLGAASKAGSAMPTMAGSSGSNPFNTIGDTRNTFDSSGWVVGSNAKGGFDLSSTLMMIGGGLLLWSLLRK